MPLPPIPRSHLGCTFIESYCVHHIVFLFHISLDPHLLRFLSWVSFLRLLLSGFLVCFLSCVLLCPLLSSFFFLSFLFLLSFSALACVLCFLLLLHRSELVWLGFRLVRRSSLFGCCLCLHRQRSLSPPLSGPLSSSGHRYAFWPSIRLLFSLRFGCDSAVVLW
mgnify:CR=1 FL=1